MNKIAILDFGSQYTHLIATRIRRLGVYSEIMEPHSASAEALKSYKGIILSGGPASVYEQSAPTVDPAIFTLGIPILGVCYGHQLLTHLLGGKVEPGKGSGSEFGKAEITIKKGAGLFSNFSANEKTQVWMSHGDRVTALPPGFEILASSLDDSYSAIGDTQRNFYGIQFHTEVTHTTKGNEMLLNFLKLCQVEHDWDLQGFIEKAEKNIRQQTAGRNVFMLVSGGVDSTVAFVLLVKALGPESVYGLFVDTGFMRDGEREQVEAALHAEGIQNLHVYSGSSEFFEALKNVTEPEKKREIIGRVFLEIQRKVAEELKLDPQNWMLGQGTIYPDTIESGGTKNSAKIKTHHNRVPEIEALIQEGRIIEPLKDLYKDEVRSVGEKLGLPSSLVWRHPFPGPGLAVRILCAQKEDWPENHLKLEETLNAFLKAREQGPRLTTNSTLIARILPIKSVGVQGDFRTYRHPVLLAGNATWAELSELAPALTNRFHDINRVLFSLEPTGLAAPDAASLPSSSLFTITPGTLTPERVKRLQYADKLAMLWLKEIAADREVWQMPTVLLPLSMSSNSLPGQTFGKESLVLRPVVSEEAMTAHFAELPMDKLHNLTGELLEDKNLSAVFYDITNKPPATIEWE